MSKVRWWALACGALVTTTTLAAPVSAEPLNAAAEEPVRETVWVDIGMDNDGDGANDRVAADIVRPANSEKAPVVMEASPYYSSAGRGNETEFKTYGDDGRPLGFPLNYDNYFVPRGYATVLVDLAGTNRSQGCVDVGGESDVASAKAVVEWLNGNAKGYDSVEGGQETSADWSTGAVGMIGKSYDGTVANAVAATGVEGLRTIVPIGAISSWYDYYRSNGTSFQSSPEELARMVDEGNRPQCENVKQQLVDGADPNGNFTPLWNDRDYLGNADKIKASVFAVHGLGDLNVKTRNFGQWWDKLAANNVERKLWLSQTGHVDPFDFRREEWMDTLSRWFDHTLKGEDNGVEKEPAATIERQPDKWEDEQTWSGEGATAEPTTMHPKPGDQPGLGTLGTEPAGEDATAPFTDDPSQDETTWADNPGQPSDARTLFTTPKLDQDMRLAGNGSVTVKATPESSSAHVSAVLVDYGPATTRDYLGQGEGIRTLQTESQWGEDRPGDDASYKDTETTTRDVDFEVVSRGWADLKNHESLSDGKELTPGEPVEMTFELAALDHVVPAGHQLGLIIGGTDSAFIDAPEQPGKVDLSLAGTSVQLPIVGGEQAKTAAKVDAAEHAHPIVRPDHVPPRPDVRLNRDMPRP